MNDSNKKFVEDLRFAYPELEGNWFLENGVWLVSGILLMTVLCLVFTRARERMALLSVRLPHETALEALRQLQSLLQAENAREFVIQVSSIIRIYIEGRFDIHAPKRTTEEFLREASQGVHLNAAHQEALARFLRACDLVKFAEYRPALAELQEVYRTARDFVEKTIPPVIDREAFRNKQIEQQKTGGVTA